MRIIAATNQNLEERIAEAARSARTSTTASTSSPSALPALRERREDIPALVDFFLHKYSREMEVPVRRISVEAMRLLESYDWPGNVRELENLIERAVALSAGDVVTAQDLPAQLRGQPAGEREVSVALPDGGLDLEAYLDQLRAQLMAQALERTGGVQTQAAELLGMTFRSFRYYAKKLGLTGGAEGDEGEAARS